jgi:hypothetical protein
MAFKKKRTVPMYLAAREHRTYEALMAPHGDRFPWKGEEGYCETVDMMT